MLHNHVRYLARVAIEFTTPFIIGGGSDFIADDCFVADANGLPLLPGSSLAGVLRHEFEKRYSGTVDSLFGWQIKADGAGSRLSVSCGCIHGSSDVPVEGRLPFAQLRSDAVLRHSMNSMPRDHVRITDRGTAADTGKFDEKVVAAGNRFTFELMLEGTAEDETAWENLLNILALPEFRIGGKSRRGFGAFKIISVTTNRFDLRNTEDFKKFCAYPVQLSRKITGDDYTPTPVSSAPSASLFITPEAFWMIGGGAGDDKADMNPVNESRIVWDINGNGTVAPTQFYMPGSSVKGALSHRTAFYHNAARGVFADRGADPESVTGEANGAVKELFGSCKEGDEGRRGCILISDLFISPTHVQKIVNHVSIDRFTGGARDGILFSEQPLYKGNRMKLELVVCDSKEISIEARTALKKALDDLVSGRLPLGAGAGRGNGFFSGELIWSDDGAWIGGAH
ncbi:MAG TPA: hypothetical protein HPP94_12855 [Desulfuromonadales bacterium]|nr:hypothetical protein [Desulfuromonadales bacterium]